MRRCNKIRDTRVEDWRYSLSKISIANILSRGISFKKFHLLSTWFTGPEFLGSNNHGYDFEGLKDKTVCYEVRIETAQDHKGNVNASVSNVYTKSLLPNQYFGNSIRHGPKSNDMCRG